MVSFCATPPPVTECCPWSRFLGLQRFAARSLCWDGAGAAPIARRPRGALCVDPGSIPAFKGAISALDPGSLNGVDS